MSALNYQMAAASLLGGLAPQPVVDWTEEVVGRIHEEPHNADWLRQDLGRQLMTAQGVNIPELGDRCAEYLKKLGDERVVRYAQQASRGGLREIDPSGLRIATFFMKTVGALVRSNAPAVTG
jgi:hypothetical protein